MGYESIRQHAGVDENLRQGGYTGGAWNPLNDMMGDLKRIVGATNPDAVEKAGNTYTSCATNMDNSATLVYDSAKRLADNWQGDAAEAALQKLKELYECFQEIHKAANPSGSALKAQAKVLRHYKDMVDGAGGLNAAGITTAMVTLPTGGIVTAAAANQMFNNDNAQDIMRKLNEDTRSSNDHFPMHMRTDVPANTQVHKTEPPVGPGGPGAGPGVGSGGGAGAGNFPKSGLPEGAGGFPGGSGSGSPPSIGAFPGGSGEIPGAGSGGFPGSGVGGGTGNFPGGSGVGDFPGSGFPGGGAGTDLAGFNPAGGGAGGGLGAGAGGGLGAGGMDPFGAGAGGGLSGGAGAGAGGIGGGIGGGNSKGGAGRGMMPMSPQSGQGEDKERERSTWLTEDEDVWSAGDDAAPPVIG